MPLRDHFRPPVFNQATWEGFHGGWPMTIVQRLLPVLPEEYTAEPRVHLGAYFEVDVGGFEKDGAAPPPAHSGGTPTLPWAAPEPTTTIDADLTEEYEYEVLVFDQTRARELVAAVELVSPANKDRAEHREQFVTKCAALLQKKVCVVIVDLVTVRRANLYAELLDRIGAADPNLPADPPSTYAVGCRVRPVRGRPRLQSWSHSLEIGKPLPTIPLWLTEDLAVPLDLEASYEDTCRALRIT